MIGTGKEIYDKDKFEEYDNLLNEISPGALYYILKRGRKNKAIVLATLLKLENKNIIKIHPSYIEVLDPNNITLKSSEWYIIRLIKDGIVNVDNIEELESKFEEDAKDCYFCLNTDKTKEIKDKIFMYYGVYLFALLYSPIFFACFPKLLILALPFIILFIIMSIICIRILGEKMIITKVGRNVRKILKKLKWDMHSITNEEMTMWPNYKAYALILERENANFVFRNYNKLIKIEEFGNKVTIYNEKN